MKEIDKLENNELNEVSGGGWGYNVYPKELYHEAGFNTCYNVFDPDYFLLRITETTTTPIIENWNASKFVTYYLSHTQSEYVEYVKTIYPEFTHIIRGQEVVV